MTAVVIGYARVSTENQTLDLQRDALTRAGCTRIYEDRMRGAKAARPRGGKGGRPKLLDPEKRRLAVALYNSMQRGIGEICRLMGSRSRRSTAISKRPVPDAPSRIPHEALIRVRHRLEALPERHPDRRGLIARISALYGLSRVTLYRGLQRERRRGNEGMHAERQSPASLDSDRDKHLEDHGAETPDGPVRLRRGLLSKATANRYLKQWGYDHDRMTRPPAAVRFQPEHSSALWHFDLSPSDLNRSIARPGSSLAAARLPR